MCYRPEDFEDPQHGDDAEALRSIGWIGEAPGVLQYVDPLPEGLREPDEDPKGVAVYRHPEQLLTEDPELWDVVDRFRSGVPLSVSRPEYEELTGFEVDCLRIMRLAVGRQTNRDLRSSEDG